MGFGVDSYDELGYARIASQHFNTRSHEHHVTAEDIIDAFPKIAAIYDEPFGNSSAVPTYVCARTAAEHGVTHLLAGDGGDELFGGNDRYVRQRVFEVYFRIPAALRTGLIEPTARRIHPDSSVAPLRKLRSYVDQARVRLPERLETWNLVYREGPAKLLHPDFHAAIDPRAPLRLMDEVFNEIPGASLLNRMLFYDWHYTLSDNDLRKVGAMCELAGVRVSYPMLDANVIDLSLRVPSDVKIKGVELRSFYKKAMADFLPEQIIRKQKHGFGLPFGVWLKTHGRLAELIRSHLDSLRRRHIVSAAFIDEIVEGHRTGDASFFGYPIWDMAMLDAWLTAHDVPA
jgi:asparagine synthase (glutamine-hydrolysing)